jgi:ribosomal protein L19E
VSRLAEIEIEKISALATHLLDVPYKKIWVDYHEEAEVLLSTSKKSAIRTILADRR